MPFKQIANGIANKPLASDLNQYLFALNAQADVGVLTLTGPSSPPIAPTLSIGSAGVLNGAYKYQLAYATGWKEDNGNIWISGFVAGPESTISPANQQVVVTMPVIAAPIVAVLVYRTVAGGPTGAEKFASAIISGLPWTDTIADGALGTGMPTWSGTTIPANVPTTNTTGTSLAQLTAYQTTVTRHQSLFDDAIQGTTQTPTYTSGQITQILHKDLLNNILRTDLFKYLSLANLITNGSFENGATGWTIATGAPSIVSTASKFGTYAMYQNNTASAGAYYSQSFNTVNGHKFYYSAWCKNTTNVTVNCDIGSYGAAIPSFSGGSSSFVYGSTIFTCTDSVSHTANIGWSTATNNGAGVWADGVTLIDLTAIWGAGNEPTQAQMDAIMALYGFIDTAPAQRIEETRTLSTGEKLSCAYNFDIYGNFVAEVVS